MEREKCMEYEEYVEYMEREECMEYMERKECMEREECMEYMKRKECMECEEWQKYLCLLMYMESKIRPNWTPEFALKQIPYLRLSLAVSASECHRAVALGRACSLAGPWHWDYSR